MLTEKISVKNEARKTNLKNYSFILNNGFSGAHWILTDMSYGHISDKEKAIKKLRQLRDDIEKTLEILES